MAASDDLISAVVIIIILFAGWFLIQYNNTGQEVGQFSSIQVSFEQERLSNDLGEILSITEPISGMPVSRLIAGAITSRGELIDLGYGREVNSKEYLSEVFNALYGENNYYLKATMPVTSLSINFVMDGSGTMSDDLDLLISSISGIENTFGKQYDMEINLYIMKKIGDDKVSCSTINDKLSKSVNCNETLLAQGNRNNNGMYVENGFDYLIKTTGSRFYIGNTGFEYEDWATGVAAIAKDLNSKIINPNETIAIIIPFSDELSTGSEASKCFTLDGLNRAYCMTCESDETIEDKEKRIERSKKTIENALWYLEKLNYAVFPVLTRIDYIPDAPYCDAQGNKLSNSTIVGSQCCGLTNCSNCTNNGLFNIPIVVNAIKEQMILLANGTGGTFIDLSSGYKGEKLMIEIINAINHALLSFEIGVKKDEERFAINRILPMGDGSVAEINFWVYKKREHTTLGNISSVNSLPIAIMDVNPKRGKVPFTINFNAKHSFDPDEREKDVNVEWYFNGTKISGVIEDTFIVQESGDHNFLLKVFDTNNPLAFSESKTIISDRNADITLFFVGVNNPPIEKLNDQASFFTNLFRNDVGLENHQIDFFAYPTINCIINEIGDDKEIFFDNKTQLEIVEKLNECWENNGRLPLQENQRLIGLSGTSIGDMNNIGQISLIAPRNQNTIIIPFESHDPFLLSHALGYTFGLCSEYSIHKWLIQNSESECPNSFPSDCNNDYTKNFSIPAIARISPVKIFCERKISPTCIGLENYLLCPMWDPSIKINERNSDAKQNLLIQKYLDDPLMRPGNCFGPVDYGITTCGNLRVDSGETPYNCPQDVLSVSCPALLDNGSKRSIMGLTNGMHGSQALISTPRKFDNTTINLIKNKIENN